MRHTARQRWDTVFALAFAIVVIAAWLRTEAPWRPTLVLWADGADFEVCQDLADQFARHSGSKVLVVGAPIERLAELIARGRTPDVLAGPATPVWQVLADRGLIAAPPSLVAFDPYVIVVPRGNPAKLKSEKDLGSGAIAAMAPNGEYPKGRCIADLLTAIARRSDAPWVPEAFYYAVEYRPIDGRLVFRPLKQGLAFVAVALRSQTTFPEARGLESIDIQPKFLKAMGPCRGSVPQCVAPIKGTRKPELAQAFVQAASSSTYRDVLAARGYVPAGDPDAADFRPLFNIRPPSSDAEVDHRLARQFTDDGLWDLALHYWLRLLHVRGPSPYDAKASYMAGYCALQMGARRAAAEFFRRCSTRYAAQALERFGDIAFALAAPGADRDDLNPRRWADKARQELAKLSAASLGEFGDDFEPGDVTDLMVDYPPTDITVIDADLPDGARRNLAVAEDELLAGSYQMALADYNRVYTVCAPNRWSPMAMTRAGECAWLVGDRAAAVDTWDDCKSAYNGKPWGDLAGRFLYLAGLEGETPVDKTLPPEAIKILERDLAPATHDAFMTRGLAAAIANFHTRLLGRALEECFKVVDGFYPPTPNPDEKRRKQIRQWRAEASYWAGIVLSWMGRPADAVRQWKRTCSAFSGTEAATKAAAAIALLRTSPGLSRAQRRLLKASAWPPPKSPFAADRRLAADLLASAGTDQTPAAVWRRVALELLQYGCWKEALEAFSEVLALAQRGSGTGHWQDEALYFSGVCLKALGHPREAAGRWRTLADRFPKSPFAARAAAWLSAAASPQEVTGRG